MVLSKKVKTRRKLNDNSKPFRTPFYKIVVPTVDTVRYEFIVSSLLNNQYPVLLVGPVGTGKTSMLQSVLNSLDEEKYSVLTLNMSAQTTSKNVQVSPGFRRKIDSLRNANGAFASGRVEEVPRVLGRAGRQAGETHQGRVRPCGRQDPDIVHGRLQYAYERDIRISATVGINSTMDRIRFLVLFADFLSLISSVSDRSVNSLLGTIERIKRRRSSRGYN